MKLMHISDLHIGKKVKGYSLIEDQKMILAQVLDVIKNRNIEGLMIAGDIYDVSNPSNEAVRLFDEFVSDLNRAGVSLFAVSGNHDSIYRVAFGSSIMAKEKIHFAKKYEGQIQFCDLKNNIRIWLLPFIRPLDAREFHPDFKTGSYEEMIQAVFRETKIDKNMTNILICHQFVTAGANLPVRSDSESVSLGTLDNIDVSNFDDFDYVALGHIHKPQAMGRKEVIYSGSPLKYSFSEKNDKKSMVILNIEGKKIEIEKIPYTPIKDMKEFRGSFEELSKMSSNDYVRLVLTDEDFIIDVKRKLELLYPNIMEIVYDNAYTRRNNEIGKAVFKNELTPIDMFGEFYEKQNNKKISEEGLKIVEEIFETLKAGEI